MTDSLQSISNRITSGTTVNSVADRTIVLPWVEQLTTNKLMFLGDESLHIIDLEARYWHNASQVWEEIVSPFNSIQILRDRAQSRLNEIPSEIEFQYLSKHPKAFQIKSSETIVNQEGITTALGFLQLVEISLHQVSNKEPEISPETSAVSTPQRIRRFPTIPEIDQLPGVVFTRAADEFWSIQYLSAGCQDLTGFSANELIDVPPLSFNSLIQEDDYATLTTLFQNLLENPTGYTIEYQINHRNDQLNWVLEKGQPIYDTAGSFQGFEGLITDITATKKAQEQLQYDAFYDKLTNLPNRSLFMDRLERLLKRTKRRPDFCFAVFFLDLDRFKVINDSLGHRAGDTLLIDVAERLNSCLRPGDTVARLGGDEFTMLIDDIQDSSDVTLVSDRILEAMKLPFILENRDVYTSTSIGIALSSIGYNQAEEMLRDADIALYQAKALGKARTAIFNPGMHIHAVAQLQLEADLQAALEKRELRLYFQPIVSLEAGIVEGLEVFVYWQHSERGLIGPNDFISVAEQTGSIISIGEWVIRESAKQVKIWHETFPSDPPLFISVNLSKTEILNTNLVNIVESILTDTQLDPRCLKLEISESSFLDSPDEIATELKKLRRLGVKICIDDFGTGYAALSYINQFPVDVIKIDRSFISQLDNKENLDTVRSVLTVSNNLKLQVVAEGVENVTQLAQLRALGCEWGQGYCLARPLEARLVETCLLQEPTGDLTSSVSVALPRLLVHTKTGFYHLLLVGKTSWTIGRGQDSSIFLSDRMVSREHAILLQLARTGDFFFVDLGSRNGSFLNGNRIETPILLKEGDRIRIGKTELEYREQTASTRTDWTEFPYKMVLMHQNYNLQGEIWREILLAQGISVIWHPDDGNLIQMLEQLEASGDRLPDLLLLELTALKPDPAFALGQLKNQYPQLNIILTSGRALEISIEQKEWAKSHQAIALLPGFNLRGNDLKTNSEDIARKVRILLNEIACNPCEEELYEAAFVALQIVIRNETLY
jgi:diguanylate cyclase (GGDEF)-like protein/PAS domain S-box-containing protein